MVPFVADTPLVMKNWVGLIDRGYRGTLRAKVFNSSDEKIVLKKGHNMFGILVPFGTLNDVQGVAATHAEFADGATLRGAGGFGSTGIAGNLKK
jgi:dUTPase